MFDFGRPDSTSDPRHANEESAAGIANSAEAPTPKPLSLAMFDFGRPDSTSDPRHANEESAVEIVTGSDGKTQQKPLSKLSSGDHTIQLGDGRQFLVHVPQTQSTAELPAVFVISGSAEPQYDAKDFAPESGMSGVADEDPKHPFVVVYPVAKKHDIGQYSAQPGWAWNAPGSLIDDTDLKNAGYSDIDYLKSVVDLVPKLTNTDASHKDWGAVGFSQGGVFLNKVLSTIPNLFPSVALVGTSMQEDYKYEPQPGNAKDVQIVELQGDKQTLPIRGLTTQSFAYDKQLVERFFLHDLKIGPFNGRKYIEADDALAAIHNEHQSPRLQNKLYVGLLGKEDRDYSVTQKDLPTPAASTSKDYEIDYTPTDPNDPRRVQVFGLKIAQHSYPAPLYGPRTNATTKYTEFDASRHFAQMFDAYNDRIHASSGSTP